MTVETRHIDELDGIRALAILLVLVWHYVACQLFPPAGTTLFEVKLILATTWSGVDLFFVLSGFLIGGILIDSRGSRVLITFYVRRACRILPLYMLVVGAFVIAELFDLSRNTWLVNAPMPLWSYLTFTQNFFMAARDTFGPNWVGITWSLAVEEQFYLVIPFVLLFAPRRLAVTALVLFVVAAPFLRAGQERIDAYVLPLMRADSLLLGVLCAFAVRHAGWGARLGLWRALTLLALVPLGALFVLITLKSAQIGAVLNHLVFAAFFAASILAAMAWRSTPLTAPLRLPLMRWIGARSFAVYMFHQLVSGSVHGALFGRAPVMTDIASVGATLASLILTFALAEISFRWLERPFLKLGARLTYAAPVSARNA